MSAFESTIFGIVGGVFSWVITDVVLRPWSDYRRLKQDIHSSFTEYANLITFVDGDEERNCRIRKRSRLNKEHSGQLRAVYFSLPRGYRKYLKCIKEDPIKAASELIAYSNEIYDFDDRAKDISERSKKTLELH